MQGTLPDELDEEVLDPPPVPVELLVEEAEVELLVLLDALELEVEEAEVELLALLDALELLAEEAVDEADVEPLDAAPPVPPVPPLPPGVHPPRSARTSPRENSSTLRPLMRKQPGMPQGSFTSGPRGTPLAPCPSMIFAWALSAGCGGGGPGLGPDPVR